MAAVPDDVNLSPGSASPVSPNSSTGQIPLEQPPKLKGRRKLLQSLQRISSSPALTRRGRSASAGYRQNGKASLSCVSLSQTAYTPCLGNGSSAQLYGGLNANPTGPGVTSAPPEPHDENARIRLVGSESPPRVIRLPTEVRPSSQRSPSVPDVSENLTPQPSTSQPRKPFDFWASMPSELKVLIFHYLTPKEIVRCSAVSKKWHKMCYDGQLWTTIDTTDYYGEISSDGLVKIITAAGPFVRDLNLRGCVQLRDKWRSEGERMTDLCQNIERFSLEGCRIDRTSVHCFLLRNPRLRYINVSGLNSVTNSAMKIIAQACPQLQVLNVSWCTSVDTAGLARVIRACPRLKDLRASEIRGFDDIDFALELFERNTLERLLVSRTDLTDESLQALMHGLDPEMDVLDERPIVPPRRLRHLDLHRCAALTDDGVKSLAYNVPNLEGLQLSQCSELTDESVMAVIKTTPRLSHLDLEDIEHLSNNTLVELAKAPCADHLEHLNISYCESMGDVGMLQIMKSCPALRSVEMDNTRISDLTLMEASLRTRRRGYGEDLPRVGLRLVIFDCANVTWAGVKEVLSSNAHVPRVRKSMQAVSVVAQTVLPDQPPGAAPAVITSSITPPPAPPLYPNAVIQLKCFYGWQMTVDEHNKRVLRGDLAAASRLDRKWADYMIAHEEAGTAGAGARRRRRRAHEAEQVYEQDEEAYGGEGTPAGGARRRRAQSSGSSCIIM